MINILLMDGSTINLFQSKNYVIESYNIFTEESFENFNLKRDIQNIDIIVLRSQTKLNKHILKKAEKLKLIVRFGIGLDNIDVNFASNKNIDVKNIIDASTNSVAELTIGHIFSLSRNLYLYNQVMRDGGFPKGLYVGEEIKGKNLGLIGFGGIGQLVAEKAFNLGMNIFYTNRSGKTSPNQSYKYLSFNDLLKESDFISLHLPINPGKPIMGEREFSLMKNGSCFINTSRGALVDEDALISFLDNNHLKAAALDVFIDEPIINKNIYTHKKIALSPHIGGETKKAKENLDISASNIVENFINSYHI